MAEKCLLQKSLMEQILDQMFALIAQTGVFDSQMVEELISLAEADSMAKAADLTTAIKNMAGRRDETA